MLIHHVKKGSILCFFVFVSVCPKAQYLRRRRLTILTLVVAARVSSVSPRRGRGHWRPTRRTLRLRTNLVEFVEDILREAKAVVVVAPIVISTGAVFVHSYRRRLRFRRRRGCCCWR